MANCSGASDCNSGRGIYEGSIVDTDINSTNIYDNSITEVSKMAEHSCKDTPNYRGGGEGGLTILHTLLIQKVTTSASALREHSLIWVHIIKNSSTYKCTSLKTPSKSRINMAWL